MVQETPYQISVSDDALELLNKKLALTRLPDEIDDAGWDYGSPLSDVRRLVARWKDGYDWRKHEKALNDELPQFTRSVEVDGHGALNVHYVHKKSAREGAIPLLFVHGWPGSFIEVRKILPLLTATEGDHPSFHVVALGMAGYGFSEGTKKKGFSLSKYGEAGHKLMLSLGYNEYVVQGGDWGSLIIQSMAATYGPTHIKAWYSNMPFCSILPPHVAAHAENPAALEDPLDRKAVERRNHYKAKGAGYFIEQSTQPQTLGYSLADSPVGLLAWIYEKLVTWTDKYPWEDDEVLTWISIYWFSLSGPAASVRTYYEATDIASLPVPPASVPFGCSFFPEDILPTPASWLTDRTVAFAANHERGGHFAAYEVPEVLAGDLRKMFGKGGPAYGVVKGKDGY